MNPEDQCQSTVLGPSGWGDYVAWRDNAIQRGLDPSYCRNKAVEEVRGRKYCRRHAGFARWADRQVEDRKADSVCACDRENDAIAALCLESECPKHGDPHPEVKGLSGSSIGKEILRRAWK